MKRRVVLLGTLTALAAAVVKAQAPREISITAHRFAFRPEEIPLKAGESVVLLIQALDFPHGFNVPDLKLRADLVPGKVIRIAIQAPAVAGPVDFLCDNFCGDGHETMHGRFMVTA